MRPKQVIDNYTHPIIKIVLKTVKVLTII